MAQTAKRDGFCEELQPSESLIKFMRQTFTNINFINALLALSTIKRMLQRKPHTALTLKFQFAMYGK